MCTDGYGLHVVTGVYHDFDPGIEIRLEPVDSVVVTTIMDNAIDAFMPDQGPAKRVSPSAAGRHTVPTRTMDRPDVFDALIAEHGFSVLVTVTKNGRVYRILFDAGMSPDGVVENMRRLDIDPAASRRSSAATATSTTQLVSTV